MLIWSVSLAVVSADDTIAEVQQKLKDQGFYYGQLNGQKDADTTAAIRRYQIRNGLQITGELNEETLNSIRSAKANTTAQPTPLTRPPVAGSPPSDRSDLPAEPAPQNDRSNQVPRDALRPPPRVWDTEPNGARSALSSRSGVFMGTPYETAPVAVQRRVIADAQLILARRGFFRDEITGAFGSDLEFSLRAYQTRLGLRPTGRLDMETLAALRLLPGEQPGIVRRPPPVMPAEPPVRGEWVRP